ncbi:hypothetical protein CEUSTIGMA_g7385.t1 [Chlamydomonas eustigma]|uniref:Mitochondrial uncoupling protein 4 n=1 Tax=Chlamydomonas eustigma TaxID=1157962 RepID=A0A250XA75_9CHLO|nr:hypothetical protein CEUSTIGMA_g7385.t1 [Chlamydomonas eustigma]|eukprot:GAX79946.1 hypothetical protein CEUSTIGMA_g7385.t1 [Chlamydomonas eustigma]
MEPYQAFWIKLALTGLSASVAETCTYPIDVVKTRLQLQGQQPSRQQPLKVGRSLNALKVATQVIHREGVKGMYSGLTPAIVRHIFYSGTRITTYEYLRSSWQRTASRSMQEAASEFSSSSSSGENLEVAEGTGTKAYIAPAASVKNKASSLPSDVGLLPKLLMGLTAGAVGQLVAVPADLVKVRFQADCRAVASGFIQQHRYKGMVHALQNIVSQEGWSGLWKGGIPAVQRAALVNLGELATYDQAKQAILSSGYLPDGVAVHAASSCVSGFVATVLSTPADVIKTRLMSQDMKQPMYRGAMDCLLQSVRREGILSLYKGFFPTWLRLGPWQLVFWLSYERSRMVAGLESF